MNSKYHPKVSIYLAVRYKTKVGSQNFGHQQWWPFVHGLPKLVANSTSYRFACQMDTNKRHLHFKNRRNLSGLMLADLELAPSDSNGLQQIVPSWKFTHDGVGHFNKLVGAHT